MTWRAQYLDDFSPLQKTKEYSSYEELMEDLRRKLEEKEKARGDADKDADSDDGDSYSEDGGNMKTYTFPDLGLSCSGQYRSIMEARRDAEEAIAQEEADGDIFDPFTRRCVTPETEPYYDDGRPEGYHGPSPKDYRWKEMYRYYRRAGRRLAREETDSFEVNPLYETDLAGNTYDRKAIVEYAWRMKRPLKPDEYGMFLVKGDDGTDDGQDDEYIPLF